MGVEKITPETEVSTTELACVLGITGRRVRQLAEDGQFEKTGQGRFKLANSVQRYNSFLSREPEDEDDIKLDKAKQTAEVTLKASKAKISKLESDELAGKMHRSEDVAAMMEDLIFSIRASLVALPGRVAAEAFEAATQAEAEEAIRQEGHNINACLQFSSAIQRGCRCIKQLLCRTQRNGYVTNLNCFGKKTCSV